MPTRKVNSADQPSGFLQSPRAVATLHRTALIGLLLASAAAAILVWAGLTSASLPGCGGAAQGTPLAPAGWGGCEQAGNSFWGRIALGPLSISTATLGCSAYLSAVVLLGGAGITSAAFRWLMRGLLAISLGFVIVALTQRLWCPYCMAAHAGVLLAWIAAECAVGSGRTASASRGVPIAACSGAVLLIAGGVVEYAVNRSRARTASSAATQSILQSPARPAMERSTPARTRFTGRYRLGSDNAKVRIVVISDFQCADCRKLDAELVELANRPGVSLSMKHFPFCTECNPNVPRTLHANACWAARAAEAAGMTGGNAAFWTMQKWLFSRGGAFTEAELRTQIAAMALPADRFMAAFTGGETLALVTADAAEAMTFGISRTPMVFVNGVECEGWENRGTVTRIVSAILEADLPVDPNASDQPPSALEKYLKMWRAARVETPARPMARQRGDGIARIEVVGDYQETGTRELCRLLSQILSEGWSAGFVFQHFPADPACNPAIPRKINDRACELSTMVLIAARPDKDEYWKAHDAALNIPLAGLASADLPRYFASATGLAAGEFTESVRVESARSLLSRQIEQTTKLGITELPTLFINGRRMVRWKGGVDSKELLRAAIAEACNNTRNPPAP